MATLPTKLPNNTVPAPLRHAHVVWNLMLENAKTETVKIPLTDEELEVLVFRGSIGNVFDSAGVSKTYYSPVRKILLDCGAITILEKGNIHNPSLVVLNPETPPPQEYPPNVKSDPEDLTDAETVDTVSRRVEVLENRLGGLSIVEALKNIEFRLSQLETQTGDRRENGKK